MSFCKSLLMIAVAGAGAAVLDGCSEEWGKEPYPPSWRGNAMSASQPELVQMNSGDGVAAILPLAPHLNPLERRVARVSLTPAADGAVECEVVTKPGSEDQYGGVVLPVDQPGSVVYVVDASFSNVQAIGRVYFQVRGADMTFKWVWNTERRPAAQGRHTIIFTPGADAGPFELLARSDYDIITRADRLQFYVRPSKPGETIGFVLHSISVLDATGRPPDNRAVTPDEGRA